MPYEPELGLVGRDETVALIESLIERRRQPLPIVVAYGPGGSGKTALLGHLQYRYQVAPMARVDLDATGSTAVRAILDVAADQLTLPADPKFGGLRLPRYELARAAVGASGAVSGGQRGSDPVRQARELIGHNIRALPRLARVIATLLEAAPPGRWLGRLLEPFLHWLIVAAVVMPRGFRWLFGSTGATLRWFESVGGPKVLQVEGRRVDGVIAECRRLAAARDGRSGEQLDRLLIRALLADIAAAYRGRRHRRVNVLFLLDDADLLPGAESRDQADADDRLDFLELLAEARLELPDVPLLVVATKQARPRGEEQASQSGSGDNSVDAAERYDAWLRTYHRDRQAGRQLGSAYLPLELPPFEPKHTVQLLALWNTMRGRTVEIQELVEQLDEVSRGHPLAVRALYRRNRLPTSLRRIFAEPLEWVGASGHWDQTVGGYLLWRFLQRLAGVEPFEARRPEGGSDPVSDSVPELDDDRSAAARDFLARLAAARRLDEATIRLLAGVDGPRAQLLLGQLANFSFTELTHEGAALTLNPLLRDLLVSILIDHQEPNGDSSYLAVHRLLHDQFERLGRRTDRLYHALALGNVPLVASQLRPWLGDGSTQWLTRLLAVTEAPHPPPGRGPLARRVRDQITRLARSKAGRVERLVNALWRLRSCTSVEPRTPATYTAVLDAYQALLDHDEIRRDDELDAVLLDYERRRQALVSRTPAPRVSLPPAYCLPGDRYPYPKFWPPRHTIRRVVFGGLTLALLAYGMVFGLHRFTYCNTPSALEFGTVVGEVFDGSSRLTQLDDGQCIGVSSRPGDFVHDRQLSSNARELTRMTELIGAENDKVLARSKATDDTRRDYVTVVVATMLSSTEELPQRDLSAGINELRGAYLAQRHYNRLDDKVAPEARLMRLVLANFGGNSEHAAATAQQIRQLVQRDPTVVAVTGLGQTRTSTLEAAEILGADGPGRVPMVGSVPSGNDFSGKQYFVRVGPTNDRQAAAAVKLATQAKLFLASQMAFVVTDNDDAYSQDLGDAFYQNLREVRPEPRRQPDKTMPLERVSYLAGSAETPGSLRRMVSRICERAGKKWPLVVYAGRTTELPTLLTELRGSSCGQNATVLGGDDLSQLETADFKDLSDRDYVDNRLFFATFGPTEAGWKAREASVLPNHVADFFTRYRDQQALEAKRKGNRAYVTGTNGHIMLAYDAVGLVGQAITRLELEEEVTRERVFEELRKTTEELPYEGAGGRVAFAPAEAAAGSNAGLDPKDKLVVLQKVVLSNGRPRAEYIGSDPAPR